MQRQRATVTSPAGRGAFLDDARATIDQILAFHAGEQRERCIPVCFEQTRSRVLLEQLNASRPESLDPQKGVLEALQRSLSDSDVVLSYAVLPRETLIWTIGRNRFELHRVAATAPEIEDLVTRLQQSIREPSRGSDTAASQRLYGLLFQHAGRIDREANVIVIPDRWLDYVPFVALHDASTGRFLVQDHSVSYAPSATLLTESLRQPHQKLLAFVENTGDRRSEVRLTGLSATRPSRR